MFKMFELLFFLLIIAVNAIYNVLFWIRVRQIRSSLDLKYAHVIIFVLQIGTVAVTMLALSFAAYLLFKT